MLSSIFERFAQESPISVMYRGLMERIFRPERLDEIFAQHSKVQYERELLFSSLVNLLSLVVCGIQPSVNAAYKAKAVELNVSRGALYQKLNGVELSVSAALLRETAAELGSLIQAMGGGRPPVLPGYSVRILDGNALASTEHRLAVFRSESAAPLPGKSLVVLDPDLGLAVDIFPCEDGHAQERRLFDAVLARMEAGQLWMADRNMCTLKFLVGIAARLSAFVIREHQNLPFTPLEDLKSVSQIESGEVLEQAIEIEYEGARLRLRRVVLRLAKPTRHGDAEIVILSNLPPEVASAVVICQLYRERWQVEGLFLTVTTNFEGEIKALAYPKAALFSFSLALVSYNILATLKAAMTSVHGVQSGENLSDYYLVDEMQGTYRGMMIAIPSEHWEVFHESSSSDLVGLLKRLSEQVDMKRFCKQPRKSKAKTPKRIKDPKHPHVSTARLLSGH